LVVLNTEILCRGIPEVVGSPIICKILEKGCRNISNDSESIPKHELRFQQFQYMVNTGVLSEILLIQGYTEEFTIARIHSVGMSLLFWMALSASS
jgi:hypothetical protein